MAQAAPNSPPSFIHNELLCFVSNKLDTLPFEVIIKNCVDFYSAEKIQEAKDLFWETVVAVSFSERRDLRNIKRKNTGASSKARADCEDVVKAMQVTDKEGTAMPKFYAVDLNNVPPGTASSLDVAVVLGQLNQLQSDMQCLKDSMKALQDSSSSCQQEAPQQNSATMKSWASVASSSSADLKRSSTSQPVPQAEASTDKQSQVRSLHQRQKQEEHQQQQQSQSLQHQHLSQNRVPATLSLTTAGPEHQTDADSGFTLVTGRKKSVKKKLEVKGNSSATLLKGVAPPPRMLELFLGRLDLSTTREAVECHINWILQGKGKAAVSEILHCAASYGYKGFKVTVPAETAELVLHADKWPNHVAVRKYFRPKGAVKSVPLAAGDHVISRSASLGNLTVGA